MERPATYQYRPDQLSTTEADRLRVAILHLMVHCRGRENAITSKTLSEYLGSPRRSIRKAIELLIADGALIGSCQDGYYVIETQEELEEVVAVLRSRATSIFARYGSLKRAWERKGGAVVQPLLFGEARCHEQSDMSGVQRGDD